MEFLQNIGQLKTSLNNVSQLVKTKWQENSNKRMTNPTVEIQSFGYVKHDGLYFLFGDIKTVQVSL